MPARAASTLRVGARGAFSFIELIVVIAVIGILAAIAIPRLSQGATESRPNATQQDLAVLQKQIDLYAVEHGGIYPGFKGDGANAAHSAKAFVAQLTMYTDYAGKASAVPSGGCHYGPYLRQGMPALKYGPKAGLDGVLVVSGGGGLTYQASQDVGWIYDDTTGEIVANTPEVLRAGVLRATEPAAIEAGG